MSHRSALRALAASVTAAAAAIVGFAPTAAQAAVDQPNLVSADPVDTTPQIVDGRVRAMATVDGVTIAVGKFTTVRENDGTQFARHNIVAFNSAGEVSTAFDPQFNGSELFDVIPSGDGSSVYVAGSFSTVNGAARPRVVRLAVHTGALDSTFKPKGINNRVSSLILSNGVLYAGGLFTRVAGADRTMLVALDPTTGADTGRAALAITGTWNGGVTGIERMTIRPDGSRLVFHGNFRYVDGQYRPQIAMVDLTGPSVTLDSWQTLGFAKTCSSTFETYIYDVDSSPDGTYFVVVATGAYSGGPSAGTLCDAASRFEWGRTGPNQQPTWVEYSGGDTFTAVQVTGKAVYVGGHFRWMNNPYASDRSGVGAVSRKGLAALDPRNGLPLSWNPGRDRGWGVWGFNATTDGLWIGHDTVHVAGEEHSRVAFFPLAGGTSYPTENTGSLPGDVVLLTNGTALTTYAFTGTGVTGVTNATGNVDWSNARAPFMIDNRVYYGLSDGTMKSRSFNGTSFGTQAGINIYRDTSWANDLKVLSSAFYDSAQGRLYYTMTGSSQLYYRYFTPENKLAGAMRFTVSTSGTGIDWSKSTGAILAGGNLYVRDNTGTLRRLTWNAGPVAGTTTAVSGPGVDGVDWSSKLMFLRAS